MLNSDPTNWNIDKVQVHVGDVPLERIRLFPLPGTAVEEDAIRIDDHEDRLCELVDGVLVEKTLGCYDSVLAIYLGYLLIHLGDRPSGVVLGTSGPYWLLPGRMRMPDVSYASWDRFPGRKLPDAPIPRMAPDLAVEILCDDNTEREMQLKLAEYFQAGTRVVWYIDPHDRTATIYTAVDQARKIDADGILDGRDVLPGFTLRLGDLFARAEGPPQ